MSKKRKKVDNAPDTAPKPAVTEADSTATDAPQGVSDPERAATGHSKASAKPGHHTVKLKTPKRYRLTFVNDNRLTEVWSIKMSRTRVIVSLAIVVFAVISIGAMLISFTPLRTLLPGYLKTTERSEYLAANARIDSLLNVVAINDLYLKNISDILSGNLDPDSLLPPPVDPQPLDTALLLGPSKAEIDFMKNYEGNGFSISSATTVLPDAPAFVAPVRQAVIIPGKKVYAPEFDFYDSKVDVFSIARGIVVDAYETPRGGYAIVIQHPDGYLSRYEGLATLQYDRGQNVVSGARIGRFANDRETKFGFTLMRDGEYLNPVQYISF